MKLTDTQLVILSAASQREDCAIELAPNLKEGAARKVVMKLLADGFIEEIEARGSMPVWRRDENKGPLALHITKRGLAAIQVDEGGAREETKEHRDAKNGTDLAPHKSSQPVAAARRKKIRDEAPRRSAKSSHKSSHGASKQDGVIEMLHRRQGATIATIMKATGWQSHSVRGFFAGLVRKKLNLTLVSEKTGKERVYRIVAKAASPKRKSKSARKTA